MTRKALGKGLRSLIPETPKRAPEPITAGDSKPAREGAGLLHIDIDLIVPNRKQPREQFDETSLEELAKSLKHKGVLQPVVVRPIDGGQYELVAGERRWRAAQRAGLLKIPAVVRQVHDDHLLEEALIENIQREDLNPMDEAQAYRTLSRDLGLTQQEVSNRVGKQRATIANMLRLLTLPAAVQAMVRSGAVSTGHAKALASVEEPSRQEELAKRIADEGLSVRQVERLVEALARTRAEPRPRSVPRRDPNVIAAEETLQKALGTKVRIIQGGKGGRIELFFYAPEELNRVYDLILGAAKKG